MATKIYTKTGDKGTTGLFGGQRVPKNSIRIEAYGAVDELNAVLGVFLSLDNVPPVSDTITTVSHLLFNLGSDLATPLTPPPSFDIPRIGKEHIHWLEQQIDSMESDLEPLKAFILPGGSMHSAQLHVARTVCRRAERCAVTLAETEEIGEFAVMFLNRLSDFLFVAARRVNAALGVPDVEWNAEVAF